MSPLAAVLAAKLRMAGHGLAGLRRHSKLKGALVTVSVVALWLAALGIAWGGLRWLDGVSADLLGTGEANLAELLLPRVLSLFALVLMIMLAVSSVLLAYGILYRSREVAFLITSPLGWRSYFVGRFAEIVFLASWSTAYLASPLVLAYGLTRHATWEVLLAAALLFVPFVAIPTAIGAMLAMVLVRTLPARPRTTAVAIAVLVIGALVVVFRARMAGPSFADVSNLGALLQLAGHAHNPFLPSTWLTAGLLAATRGDEAEVAFQLLLLLANAALLLWLATELAGLAFYPGWSRLSSAGRRRTQRRRGWNLERAMAVLSPTRGPAWWLTVKDVRGFTREPTQWGQLLMFFGILAVYLGSMRTTAAGFSVAFWQSFKTLLNTVASLLVVATLTTRFVFPLISLEGRRFWILGLAPVTRRQLVIQKLALSIAATSTITVTLVSLSSWRLGLATLPFAVAVCTVLAASVALSGLAVGLGSLYADFTQEDPARIVSGLGGTLTLIASVTYVVVAAAGQTILLRVARHASVAVVVLGVAGIALASGLVTWLALHLGIRSLETADL